MDPLVTAAWVFERLSDPNLVLLDATLPPVGVLPKPDMRVAYLEAHLPGAVFFDIDELSDKATTLPHMLPSAQDFGRAMSALGVSDTATLVVYEQGAVFSAPRARWMLRTFGAENVFLLDGGLRSWIEAGLPTQTGPVQRKPAEFRARLQAEAVRDLAEVQRLIGAGVETEEQILDARSTGRFAGTAPEPRPGLRSGHMPGSTNVPYTELTRGDRLKNAEELAAVFDAKGVDRSRAIITTCGSGVTAAVVALGLEICGAPQVSLYDGSWAEYAQQPGAKIENGS